MATVTKSARRAPQSFTMVFAKCDGEQPTLLKSFKTPQEAAAFCAGFNFCQEWNEREPNDIRAASAKAVVAKGGEA